MEPDYTEDITSAFRRLQSALAETYPETFQTFEDADNIYQTLMCSNVRTRLGISDATYEAKSSVIVLHQEDNFSPAQHVDPRLKSVTNTISLATRLSTTLRKRVLNPTFPPIFGRMTSRLQDLFGGSSRSSGEPSKSRSLSHSVLAPPINTNMPIVYNGKYASVLPTHFPTRSHSPTTSRINRPSPLRYNTYDSSTIFSKTRPTRSAKARDSSFPYPLYTPAAAKYGHHRESFMTAPTLSIQSHTSFGCFASRATCSTSAASRQAHTWHNSGKVDGPRPHVSFVNPNRPQTLHMHPLLAASSHSRAPISYDVMFPPSPQTVVDRTTRTAVPSHTLGQPATDPPTCSTLVLRSDRFPWPIVGLVSKRPVTNSDLILTLYNVLSSRVTREEWDALGKGSRAQRKVTRAYERRTRALGDEEGGVRRIDWLGEKTRLIGIEVDKTAIDLGVAKLIFGKP
ncbi:hypothetical protein VKT23_007716 [Stygiomarasmius scandens]|uniref:DUF6699 domain-containing protein n=1 Tax=Marasmiellus scandens TaxID=2682957 RepID=A0ABR1JL76_9AGAR